MLQIGLSDRNKIEKEIKGAIRNGRKREIMTVTLPRYSGNVTVNVSYRKFNDMVRRLKFGNTEGFYSINDSSQPIIKL
ncbi:hypothetical protein ACWYRQ_13985 [Clostridioides difficile]